MVGFAALNPSRQAGRVSSTGDLNAIGRGSWPLQTRMLWPYGKMRMSFSLPFLGNELEPPVAVLTFMLLDFANRRLHVGDHATNQRCQSCQSAICCLC